MLTAQQIEAKASDLATTYADGLSWDDAYNTIAVAMEVAEDVKGIDGPAKKKLALDLLGALLSRVDLPGPDAIVRPVLLMAAPYVMDLIATATRGGFKVNE